MRPEVHDAKEGKIDGDTVKEGAYDGRRANVLGGWVFRDLRAGADVVGVVGAVRLFAGVAQRVVTVRLGAVMCVLRSDYHGEGVVNRKCHESEHDRGHQESLWRGVTLSDLEDLEPEEPDSEAGDTEDRASEKEEHEEEEDHVVDGENLCGFDEYPIDRVEDVGVGENVTAVGFANGILSLVNASKEHRYPYENGHEHKEDTAKKFDRTKYGFNLDPRAHNPALTFTASLSR